MCSRRHLARRGPSVNQPGPHFRRRGDLVLPRPSHRRSASYRALCRCISAAQGSGKGFPSPGSGVKVYAEPGMQRPIRQTSWEEPRLLASIRCRSVRRCSPTGRAAGVLPRHTVAFLLLISGPLHPTHSLCVAGLGLIAVFGSLKPFSRVFLHLWLGDRQASHRRRAWCSRPSAVHRRLGALNGVVVLHGVGGDFADWRRHHQAVPRKPTLAAPAQER